jgi:hypothetical protein
MPLTKEKKEPRRSGRRPKRVGSAPSRNARRKELEDVIRPIVREVVAEELEDRLDYWESEASLADGDPLPAEEVWKKLGL